MATLYKLTDPEGYTRRGEKNETLWGENVSHTATGKGGLCSNGVIHAYEHPLVAVFMNPVYSYWREYTLLWEAEGQPVVRYGQLQCGVKTLTTLRKIAMPSLNADQRASIALWCALAIYNEPVFVKWAESWIDGSDRSEASRWAVSAAGNLDYVHLVGPLSAATIAVWAAREALSVAQAAEFGDPSRRAPFVAETVQSAMSKYEKKGDFDLLSIIMRVVDKQ